MIAPRSGRAAALALFLAGTGAGTAVPAHDGAAPDSPRRVALLARAETALEKGDAAGALDDFERAAMMRHAPDAELGLIRAALQDGQYRRALAFCAHTAGEHTEAADGAALYAWLLRLGGQPALAARVLADAQALVPADAVLAAEAVAFAQALPVASGALLDLPHRLAPSPVMRGGQAAVPASARFAGGAVLAGDGSVAVMPAATLDAASAPRIWVRNGLGETTEAALDSPPGEAAGVLLLRLKSPLGLGESARASPREPFAGSPGYVLQFAATRDAAWPWLEQGFLGGAQGRGGLRRLGFGAEDATPGAPVLDAQGRLAGMTMTADAGWLPVARWPPMRASASATAEAGAAPPGLAAPDRIYEAGLRRALQVLVDASR